MQPYFLPYIGYFQLISAVDRFLLYDWVSYIKRGWVNRNRHSVINGEPAFLIIPVREKSSSKRLRDIEIDDREPWRRRMLKALFLNYKKAPYFESIYPLMEQLIRADTPSLSAYNTSSITTLCRFLGLTTEIVSSTELYRDVEDRLAVAVDQLPGSFPDLDIAGLDRMVVRVLALCRQEGADTYVNAIGGRDLYPKSAFDRNQISIYFVQTDEIRYPQGGNTFHPSLSIIDVLMYCGREQTRTFLSRYTLI